MVCCRFWIIPFFSDECSFFFCSGRHLAWLGSNSQHYLSCNRYQQKSQLRSFQLPAISFCWKLWHLLQMKGIQFFRYSLYRKFVATSFLGFHLLLCSGSGIPRFCPLAPPVTREQISASVLSDHCCLGG